eukprot:scpid100289/ scgid17681/ 
MNLPRIHDQECVTPILNLFMSLFGGSMIECVDLSARVTQIIVSVQQIQDAQVYRLLFSFEYHSCESWLVTLVKPLYDNGKSSVLISSTVSDWFRLLAASGRAAYCLLLCSTCFCSISCQMHCLILMLL